MSLPERIPTYTSQTADIRVNRGSTWIRVAPFSLAFMGQRKPTGCASAMLDPIQDAIAVRHVLLIIGGRAAAEGGAQTGHRSAMSYPRLVLDRYDSQPAAEKLLNEVVLLIVDGRPAQRADG